MKLQALLLLWLLVACTPELANPAQVDFATAIPTVGAQGVSALCRIAFSEQEALSRQVEALNALWQQGETCSQGAVDALFADRLAAYGSSLVETNQQAAALEILQRAYELNPTNSQVVAQLAALGVNARANIAIASATTANCPTLAEVNILPYEATDQPALTWTGSAFEQDSVRWPIQGANYYPQQAPFSRFVPDAEAGQILAELPLLVAAGINTVRLTLDVQQFFRCDADLLVPNNTLFEQLDMILRTIADQNLRIIIVLYDAKTLDFEAESALSEILVTQTTFFVNRYQTEKAIIAWDVLINGGEVYAASADTQPPILNWLVEMVGLLKEIDPQRPVTAGWRSDAIATAPLVDFVSIEHFGNYEDLRQRVANLRAQTNKPLLLTAIGYSTYTVNETTQRDWLFQAFDEVTQNNLLGWNVYMAFDYPLSVLCNLEDCTDTERDIARYGLWNTSYFPKLAVEAVLYFTGVESE